MVRDSGRKSCDKEYHMNEDKQHWRCPVNGAKGRRNRGKASHSGQPMCLMHGASTSAAASETGRHICRIEGDTRRQARDGAERGGRKGSWAPLAHLPMGRISEAEEVQKHRPRIGERVRLVEPPPCLVNGGRAENRSQRMHMSTCKSTAIPLRTGKYRQGSRNSAKHLR